MLSSFVLHCWVLVAIVFFFLVVKVNRVGDEYPMVLMVFVCFDECTTSLNSPRSGMNVNVVLRRKKKMKFIKQMATKEKRIRRRMRVLYMWLMIYINWICTISFHSICCYCFILFSCVIIKETRENSAPFKKKGPQSRAHKW